MDDIMSITRSLEKGMYILREGDCLWRIDEKGRVEDMATGLTRVFEQLAFIQQWKTPSRGIFEEHPQQDPSI